MRDPGRLGGCQVEILERRIRKLDIEVDRMATRSLDGPGMALVVRCLKSVCTATEGDP
jgi:hypothetical protein